MTPVDIARIFKSPLVIVEQGEEEERDEGLSTDELVEKIGSRKINDFVNGGQGNGDVGSVRV